jgi:uncharacterized protein YjbI with pentapeptide repeats/energy-coupling factor transporter ATP-binding protein EcfA2
VLRNGQRFVLEEEVDLLLSKRRGGHILLLGHDGSGKTTALRHLAYVFAGQPRLRLVDEEDPPKRQHPDDVIVQAAPSVASGAPTPQDKRYLAPWDEEQCAEYVAAAHSTRVVRTMTAWQRAGLVDELGRWPGLCTCALDHFALTPDADSFTILREVLEERLPAQRRSTAMRQALRSYALAPAIATEVRADGVLHALSLRGLLAAEHLVGLVVQQQAMPLAPVHWHASLLEGVRKFLAHAPDVRMRLEVLVQSRSVRHRSVILSLLNAAADHYRPPADAIRGIPGARLAGADLRRIQFLGDLSQVDLADADLREARLDECSLSNGILRGALLERASLTFLEAPNLQAPGIHAQMANLRHSRLTDANLHSADFAGANLRGALLMRSNLQDACLRGADLTGADLTSAILKGADLTGARLAGAQLRDCHLDANQLAQIAAKCSTPRGLRADDGAR